MSNGIELENALFLLRSSLNNLRIAIESFGSPVLTVSDTVRQNLTSQQVIALEKSFLNRAERLEVHFNEVNKDFIGPTTIENLRSLQYKLQKVRDHYFLSEQVFDYYVDLLHTRSEPGMGIILKGCDQLAHASLKQGLQHLDKEIPEIVCYVDRGDGASIMRAGIYLWDYQTNPAAIIKVVRSAIPLPRLTSILHECGHQAAHITGWNRELAGLIYKTILSTGCSKRLAELWSSWASEIAADFWALPQGNFSSLIGLAEVITGSASRIFGAVQNDPHPMGYIRILLGITACRLILGSGPWDDYSRVFQTLFPIKIAKPESAKIAAESLPLLPLLCNAILNTKMDCFAGKTLQEVLPWDHSAPNAVRSFLNNDLSNFSVDTHTLVKHPILTLTCFRYIQMFGGRPQQWLRDQIRNWLICMASGDSVRNE